MNPSTSAFARMRLSVLFLLLGFALAAFITSPALAESDEPVIQQLADGANPNSVDSHGRPWLVTAAEQGDVDLCRALLQAGADPDKLDKSGFSALFMASMKNHPETLRILLAHKANPNNPDQRCSPLTRAALEGFYVTAKALLDGGADINFHSDQETDPPLVTVLYRRDNPVLELLLERGADVNIQGVGGDTPLLVAVRQNDLEGARTLLDHGALPDAGGDPRSRYHPPLSQAIRDNNIAMARMLIKAGADVNRTKFGRGLLLNILEERHVEILELLLASGADVNKPDRSGNTPLHHACQSNNRGRVVAVLLAHGARLDARTNAGSTPLHRAAIWGGPETCRLLIEAGADVNAKDDKGFTPLYWARKKKDNQAVVDLLLRHGAREN